ncbi:minor tail protein [Mycobacterium phage Ritam007]|nr:hypothetical protein Saroj_23 [Mycobacterium phage Saroj]UZV39549.1 minor tail protein [Mycobacterium phage Ritam007]
MQIKTDHQIVAFGNDQGEDLMGLFDMHDTMIVQASRTETGWKVTADGADPVDVESRGEAINAMIEMALEVLPGDGYSCLVPHGLQDQP